jgi:hypothetical protein
VTRRSRSKAGCSASRFGEETPSPPKEGQILTAKTQIILLVALIVGWYVFKALWLAWWSPWQVTPRNFCAGFVIRYVYPPHKHPGPVMGYERPGYPAASP